MAIKRDELADPNSCLNRAADDEPIFVLRAKDPLAAGMVRQWAAEANLDAVHEDAKIQAAWRFAAAMEAWRKAHCPAPEAPKPGEKL